jgi:hypothetical protein
MNKISVLGLMAVICLVLAGCQSTAPPSLTHPGPAQVQQNRAVRFDPYPEKEMGPDMVGVRPRDYENPLPEPSRSRWQVGNTCPPVAQ